MGELDEEAKAVKALSELGSDAIEAATKAGAFFTDLLGHGPRDWVALKFSDRQKFKRAIAAVYDWNNLIRVAHLVDSNLIRDGITQRRNISAKLGIEFIECASLESDEDIQKLYAELYASAVNPSATNTVEIKHLQTLKSLTGADLITLENIYAEVTWINRGHNRPFNLERPILNKAIVDKKLKTLDQFYEYLSSPAANVFFQNQPIRDVYAIQSLLNAGVIQRGLVDVNADLNAFKNFTYQNTSYRRPHGQPLEKMVRGSDVLGGLTPYGLVFCLLVMPEFTALKDT